MMYTIKIIPCTKPKKVKSDTWRTRPQVLQYLQYKSELRRLTKDIIVPGEFKIEFYLPMLKTFKVSSYKSLNNKPHQRTPDVYNLLKGFMDALLINDRSVWHVDAYKYWSLEPKIKIIF